MVASGVGEEDGGVSYCEVVYDAPDVISANLGLTYMINSIPTLLSFDGQQAFIQSKVIDGKQLADPTFLEAWIVEEARRHGNSNGGGNGPGLFSGLFSKNR